MAYFEEDLYEFLSAESTLTDLVSTRVQPAPLAQGGTLPAISYRRVSATSHHDHDGVSGLYIARIQFDCVAATYPVMVDLRSRLVALLDGKSGDMAGRRLGRAEWVNTFDGFADQTERFRTVVDFEFAYYD